MGRGGRGRKESFKRSPPLHPPRRGRDERLPHEEAKRSPLPVRRREKDGCGQGRDVRGDPPQAGGGSSPYESGEVETRGERGVEENLLPLSLVSFLLSCQDHPLVRDLNGRHPHTILSFVPCRPARFWVSPVDQDSYPRDPSPPPLASPLQDEDANRIVWKGEEETCL